MSFRFRLGTNKGSGGGGGRGAVLNNWEIRNEYSIGLIIVGARESDDDKMAELRGCASIFLLVPFVFDSLFFIRLHVRVPFNLTSNFQPIWIYKCNF